MVSSIGVVGAGFVGGAVARGFGGLTDVKIYDVDPKRATYPFADVAEQDVVFICVPTPTNSGTGACDLTILDSVLERLNTMQSQGVPVGIVVVKSTVPPGVVLRYCTRYSALRFVSNPEFLTERTADYDFQNPKCVVLGCEDNATEYRDVVEELYDKMLGMYHSVPFVRTTHDAAALIKYGSNCFFAVKVAFFNEIKQLCDNLGVGYESVRRGIIESGWVSPDHTMVPGPDGYRGFGGKCFPKDVMALARFARDCGVDPVLLRAALEKNSQVREVNDWEYIAGAMS